MLLIHFCGYKMKINMGLTNEIKLSNTNFSVNTLTQIKQRYLFVLMYWHSNEKAEFVNSTKMELTSKTIK